MTEYSVHLIFIVIYLLKGKPGGDVLTESELLKARIDDCIGLCEESYLITNTNFLDIYQQSSVIEYLRNKKGVHFCFYGGFEDSERKIALFFPEYAESLEYIKENSELSPITSIRISKDDFSTLSHRDYLGAVMGLGIKREAIGDIFVSEKGCTMAVIKSVAPFIKENLISVGRGSVKVEINESFEDVHNNSTFETKRCYVSSMRLDGVLSAAFAISRNTAVEAIRKGVVLLNGIVVQKPDARVPFGSKLVIHGKGKVMVDEDAGVTKKGRQAFIIRKY